MTSYPLANLAALAQRLHAGEIDAATYVALYVLSWQVARYGRAVAQRRSRRDPAPDGIAWLNAAASLSAPARTDFLVDIYARYELRGVRRRVGVTVCRWLHGDWNPTLRHAVPPPRAVLRLQAAGTRPVTAIAAYPQLLRPVLDKPDAYAFVCHDLEHAWQFFHDPRRCRAQQRFAQRLDRAWTEGAFDRYLADPIFAEKFAYLAADMNTHILHSLQYLRAILISHHLRNEGLGAHAPLSSPARAAVEMSFMTLLGEAGRLVAAPGRDYRALDVAALEAAL